jgi:AraC-like DNA-binding protein
VLESVDTPESIDEPFAIVAEEDVAPVPVEFPPHRHRLHELVWVRGGAMTARVGDRLHTVPSGQGLWIPAGAEHSGRMTARTRLCDALFDPERSRVTFSETTEVLMTPVLESLLTHLARPDLTADERLRAEAVVFDVLAPAARRTGLNIPTVASVAPIVSALMEHPGDQRTAADWAQDLGISERTISRAFRSSTGLSMVQWRQALRVHRALVMMAEGLQVQEIARAAGLRAGEHLHRRLQSG